MSARPASLHEPANPARPYDAERVRADFPILAQHVNGRPLVYLDSAASSQQPRAVIDAVERYATRLHANVHRGVHTLSQLATEAFEGARERVRAFIGAASSREVVFVRGTTEAINLVAQSWGRQHLAAGDEVLITQLEHHANIVPWQMVCRERGAHLRVAPIDARGQLDSRTFAELLGPRTRLAAFAFVSNALGTVLPVARMIEAARARGVVTLVDAAQAVAHAPLDVRALGCDFLAFSGHKMYAPTGIGVLYGREALLAAMPPWQGGGDMIRTVSYEEATWNDLPWKFEAGTPNMAGAVGLAAAIDYLQGLGLGAVAAHEHSLLEQATAALGALPGVVLHGTAAEKAAVLSFTMQGIHPHDLGTILDHEGVAIRTGHHCAMPLMDVLGVPATARASFACYNTADDVARFIQAVVRARQVFA